MKRDLKYNMLVALIMLLFFTSAALCQQKRISEFVELPHADSSFIKNMPLGSVVLDTTAKQLYRLTSYTASGTSLTSASKVSLGGSDGNGIYSGSDTLSGSTIVYMQGNGLNLTGNSTSSFKITNGSFANAFTVSQPIRASPTNSPLVGVNTIFPVYDEEFQVNGNSEFLDDVNIDNQLQIDGAGTTSSTYSLIANDNVANTNFFVRDDGAVSSRLGYWIAADRVLHLLGTNSISLGLDAGNSINASGVANSFFGFEAGKFFQGGDNCTFLGYRAGNSVINANNIISIGYLASAVISSSSDDLISIGNNSTSTTGIKTESINIGYNSGINIANSTNVIAIGRATGLSASGNLSDAILIGRSARATNNNQFVTGSSSSPLTNYYIGRGVEQTQANLGSDGVTLQSTSVAAGETDIDATFPFTIAGGVGTGTGVGADLLFKVSPGATGGASGSTQNPLDTALQISPDSLEVISHYAHQFNNGINFNTPDNWVYKEIEIGDWDMDADSILSVAHGLSSSEWKTIRSINVVIRNDADDEYYNHYTVSSVVSTRPAFNSTNIVLRRDGTGFFDSTDFDSTSYNRGYITFWYKI